MRTTTVRMSDEIDFRVRRYAEKHGLSLNQAMVQLFDEGTKPKHRGPIFSFSSGRRTTIEDLDRALEEGFGES